MCHLQLHIEQMKKLQAFITHPTKSNHSEQDLRNLLEDQTDEVQHESENGSQNPVTNEFDLNSPHDEELPINEAAENSQVNNVSPVSSHSSSRNQEFEYHIIIPRLLQLERELCRGLELVITVRCSMSFHRQ